MLSLLPKFSPWPLAKLATNVWTQFRFENNSLLDEVTEAEILLSGAALVTNGAVTVGARAATNFADINNVSFDDDENFYIRADFTSLVPPSNHLNQTIMGVWTGNNGWAIIHQGPSASVVGQRNKVTFSYLDRTGVQHAAISASTVSYDEEHTVEIYRINGVITIYIDGIPGTSVNARLGNNATASGIIRMFRHSQSVSTQYGAGTRRNIQIVKGDVPYRPGKVPTIKPYVRPQYTKEVADSIMLQLGFRRGSRMCEVTDAIMNLSGSAAITKQARLTTTASTASYGAVPLPKFGQGDFTVEFMCNFSAIHTTIGVRIGHWSNTGGGVDAVWCVYIDSNRRVSFIIARSDTVGDSARIQSVDGVFKLNQNNHVVIQREAGVATIYLNGVIIAQGELDLPIRKQTMFRTNAANNSDHATGSYWNIRIADRALYTETEEPGAPEYGFIGEVSSADLITGDALAAALGLTAGISQFSDEPWLHFNDPVDGKTKYVAKKPYRHTISWVNINDVNAVFGNRTLVIQGKNYRVRLMNGAISNPYEGSIGYDQQGTHGSEWNRLMYRISDGIFTDNNNKLASEGITEGDQAQYSEADLLTHHSKGSGTDCWCQEASGSNRICRGSYGVSYLYIQSPATNRASYGWRPVLDLLPEPNGTTIVDFVSGGVIPLESGIIKRGSVTSGYGYTRLNAANSFLELPHNPALAVGTGNFRFEITFTFHGNASNVPERTNPLLTWRTWAAPGQPMNLEISWHPNNGGLYIATDNYNAPVAVLTTENPVVGQRYKMVIERIDGVVHLLLNDVLVNSVTWTNNIKANVNRPILIGQRYGGSSYSVYWTTLMSIEHCWFGTPR